MAEGTEMKQVVVHTEGENAGPSRDLNKARDAFDKGDVAASKAAHDAKKGAGHGSEEMHGGLGSEYVKSIIFGGLDGIITTFAIISASAGAGFSLEVILLMGFANLIADGISMGFGDYLSEKAELDHALKEYKREKWELENNKAGEVQEMVEIYTNKGLSEEDATTMMNIMAKHEDAFLDMMMVDELGLSPPDEDDAPWKNGCVTFLSFLVFGSVPLWCYVIFYVSPLEDKNIMFGLCIAATALTMFLLGVFKARVTHQNIWRSGFLMTLNGSIAAASAYLVGWIFEEGFKIDMTGC